MVTNFYAYLPDGTTQDGRSDTYRLHVGKSSAGWVFQLHVFAMEYKITDLDLDTRGVLPPPMLRLNPPRDLERWREILHTPGVVCLDEWGSDGGRILPAQIMATIERRKHRAGLRRARLDDPGVLRHGSGTWDLIEGDFS